MKLRIILLSYFYKDIYFNNLMLPAKRFKKFFPALSLVLFSMKYDYSYYMSGNNSYPVIMQAVVLETPGSPLQVKEVDIPGPGPDEVLIKIAAESSLGRMIELMGKKHQIPSQELSSAILFDSVCGSQLYKIIEALPFGSSVVIYGNLSEEEQVMINPRKLLINIYVYLDFILVKDKRERSL